jgi:outer membrane protein assembly factor BamB
VVEGVVVVASRDGILHGVAASSGAQVWKLESGPELPLPWGYEGWDYILSSPAVAGDRAFWGSGDGNIYAVDPASGRVHWKYPTSGRVRSTPAVSGDLLAVGNSEGVVYALDTRNGEELWHFQTEGATLNSADFGFDRRQISSSPAIRDGTVYVGSRDASLYALDARDGEPVWVFSEDSAWIIATPAVTEDRVISGRSSSGNVRALNRETGEEEWHFEAGAYVYSSPVVVGNTAYMGQGDGGFVAVDIHTGRERWSYRTGNAIYSTPVVHQGRIFVGSDDGFVYAFEAADRPLERAVFFDDSMMGISALGSSERHFVVRDHFTQRGYSLLDSAGLRSFLEARILDGASSVVVFAMDVLPPFTEDRQSETLLIRYLQAGGKIVWMGYPPGYLVRDPVTQAVVTVDRDAPTSLLGVNFDVYLGDQYGLTVTDEGREWGLRTRWVGQGTTLPTEVTEVLAIDELGRAGAWVKNYGGRRGSGFVLLPVSLSADRLEEFQRIAEFFPSDERVP